MNNTDKAMKLANSYAIQASLGNDCSEQIAALRAHIESMQRDCRTCGHLMNFGDMTGGARCIQHCTNHDRYERVEFKQLTRIE